jgi:hypothetical protein
MIQIIVAMTIAIPRGSWWWRAQYSSEWYNNHNKSDDDSYSYGIHVLT